MSQLDGLVVRTVAGDAEAWRALQIAVEPQISRIARNLNVLIAKGVARSEDALREITVATLERFARNDFHNLRRFLEGPKDPNHSAPRNFDAWLYGAVRQESDEFLRRMFGRAPQNPQRATRLKPNKRRVGGSLAERIDDEENEHALLETISMTTRLKVAEIYERVQQSFTKDEAKAFLFFYLHGLQYEELATELALDDIEDARRLIHKLNARLRSHFASAS